MKKKFPNIKNIIFDLGGVIIDIDQNQIVNHLKDNGFNNIELLNSDEVKRTLSQFERGILSAETFRKQLCSQLNLDVSAEEFDDIWNSMILDIPQRRIDLVKKLRGNYHVFLMSNSNEIHYDLFIRDLQLRFGYREFDSLFDKSFFSFDTHICKPDPDFFIYVLDRYNMKPEETLFIDDTPENIITAQKLGIVTYHSLTGARVVDLFENGLLKEDLEFDVIHESNKD